MSSIGTAIGGHLAPLASPLPDAPAGEAFTPNQWATLMAIMDTVIPSVRKGAASSNKISQHTISDVEYNKTVAHLKKTAVEVPGGEALNEYLEEKPSDNPRFQALLKRSLVEYTREDGRKNLAFVLTALK